MPKATIEYMNARQASKEVSGGTNYRKQRRMAGYEIEAKQDGYDLALSYLAEFRSWFDNLPSVAELYAQTTEPETDIPF